MACHIDKQKNFHLYRDECGEQCDDGGSNIRDANIAAARSAGNQNATSSPNMQASNGKFGSIDAGNVATASGLETRR
jgi:hypothetical protein